MAVFSGSGWIERKEKQVEVVDSPRENARPLRPSHKRSYSDGGTGTHKASWERRERRSVT